MNIEEANQLGPNKLSEENGHYFPKIQFMKESPIKMNSAETFDCIKCQSQFTFRHNLSKHIQSVHEGEKYDSNQCDHQATQQSSLKSENSYSIKT